MNKPEQPRKALGKGLGALLQTRTTPVALPTHTEVHREEASLDVPIDSIDPNPHQPRRVFEQTALEELAQSIRANGIIQPLVVRRTGNRYQLHLATGTAVTPRKWEEAGWAPPAPQLPSLEIKLDGDVDEFLQKVGGQHYIISYGDNRAAFADLCQILNVEVI